jgi:hypothetical protein
MAVSLSTNGDLTIRRQPGQKKIVVRHPKIKHISERGIAPAPLKGWPVPLRIAPIRIGINSGELIRTNFDLDGFVQSAGVAHSGVFLQ